MNVEESWEPSARHFRPVEQKPTVVDAVIAWVTGEPLPSTDQDDYALDA